MSQLISLDIPPFLVSQQQNVSPQIRVDPATGIRVEWLAIPELDKPVYMAHHAFCDISFPFKGGQSRTYSYLFGSEGITKRALIKEIRNSYQHFYRHSLETASALEACGSSKKIYRVLYPLHALYVVDILYNPNESSLHLATEGFPFPLSPALYSG